MIRCKSRLYHNPLYPLAQSSIPTTSGAGFEVYGYEKRALKVGETYVDEEHRVLWLQEPPAALGELIGAGRELRLPGKGTGYPTSDSSRVAGQPKYPAATRPPPSHTGGARARGGRD